MKLLSWFLKTNEKELQEAALAYERSKRTGASISAQEAHRAALDSLAGRWSVLMGALVESGVEVNVGTETTDRHSIIVGATGSGKTRAIIDRLMRRLMFSHPTSRPSSAFTCSSRLAARTFGKPTSAPQPTQRST